MYPPDVPTKTYLPEGSKRATDMAYLGERIIIELSINALQYKSTPFVRLALFVAILVTVWLV